MLNYFNLSLTEQDIHQRDEAYRKLQKRYEDYSDPWGFNLHAVKTAIHAMLPFYRNYFRVRVFGIENVQDKPYMIVSNHTGQVPIDAMLITMAFAYEFEKPRVVHSMIERFMAALPFIGDFVAQTGAILGDRDNCKWLLKKGESILVFPEGVRGINKKTKDFYQLQPFSSGFYRIAIQAETEILPISVIGAEEMFPIVLQAPKLGKKLGLPNLPLSANLFPLPSPIDIYIGKPISVESKLCADSSEKELKPHLYCIEKQIKESISKGLADRREFLDKIRKPINDIMKKL